MASKKQDVKQELIEILKDQVYDRKIKDTYDIVFVEVLDKQSGIYHDTIFRGTPKFGVNPVDIILQDLKAKGKVFIAKRFERKICIANKKSNTFHLFKYNKPS